MTIQVPSQPADLGQVLTEEQARAFVADTMRVVDGLPVSWWGPDREIVVATHDATLAAHAADVLYRDGGSVPADAAAVMAVKGPVGAVLVRQPDRDERVDWRPAGPDADYALLLCRVFPTAAQSGVRS